MILSFFFERVNAIKYILLFGSFIIYVDRSLMNLTDYLITDKFNVTLSAGIKVRPKLFKMVLP